VLVLDDDPQVAELQRIYLEEMGYAAEVARDPLPTYL
jgi:DNA-binding response OmpR family regulator